LWGGLLFGCAIALKLTNIVFMLPLVVWIVGRGVQQKAIKITSVSFAGRLGLAVVLPVAVHALYFTGNPVFPFFNGIFASPYFPAFNTKDPRWGPESFLGALFWPFVSFVQPARLDMGVLMAPVSNGRAALGYLAVFCSLFAYYETDLWKKRLPLALALLSCGLLWSFSTGHVRYGVALEVFASLYALIWIFDLFALKRQVLRQVFTFLLAVSVLISSSYYYQASYGRRPTAQMPLWGLYYVNTELADFNNPETYKIQFDYYLEAARGNLAFIGRDRQVTRDAELREKLGAVKTWLCYEPLTQNSLMMMANPEADFIFLYKKEGYGGFYQESIAEFLRGVLPAYDEMSLYAIVDLSWGAEDMVYFLDYFEDLASAGLAVVESEAIELDMGYAGNPYRLLRLMTVETAERLGLEALTLEDVANGER
jgi:hypothetical protein